MSLLALGTCLVIAASAQTKWKSPRVLAPLLHMGQYSYEIYLTHMFVVFALFDLFIRMGKRMSMVAPFFLSAIVFASILGAIVAHTYSEPMNRLIRKRSTSAANNAPVVETEVIPASGT
jgi:peptidoglycan/LPS O-acetylase OafA/YrhL